MQTPFLPSNSYPSLTTSRLMRISDLVRDRWLGIVALHNPAEGDNKWARNCRAYAWICAAITKASVNEPWLTVVRRGMEFTFRIDGVPIRFYNGDAFDPPSRHLMLSWAEKEFQSTPAFEEVAPADRFFRLAIDVSASGEVDRVTLVELQEPGTVLHYFDIPANGISEIVETKAPVELGEPDVHVIDVPKKRKDAQSR